MVTPPKSSLSTSLVSESALISWDFGSSIELRRSAWQWSTQTTNSNHVPYRRNIRCTLDHQPPVTGSLSYRACQANVIERQDFIVNGYLFIHASIEILTDSNEFRLVSRVMSSRLLIRPLRRCSIYYLSL